MTGVGLPARLVVVEGDIVHQDVDALVNAANTSLLGGGGVDGAIHRAAGPELLAACRALGGCATGEARITPGFRLKARFVIHAVGPVWSGGVRRERELLRSAYERSLELARDHDVRTLAFPSISTGAYGFPMDEAARIALETCARFLASNDVPEVVTFVCFGEQARLVHEAARARVLGAATK
jgi:O-acetyl-ADP-ribose deacetylase (regulator of RNase III)